MNLYLIALGIVCFLGAAYAWLRARRTPKGELIKGGFGTYYEPWSFYVRALVVFAGGVFLVIVGLLI